MTDLRFDGRVAVITGAGRGLGRSYALLLASRGAKVVVNDIGVTRYGADPDAGPAQDVVNEIKAAGGEAVANTDSVSTAEGGNAIVQTAIDAFGRIDILIANAGFNRPRPFDEISLEDFEAILGVHLMGGYHVAPRRLPADEGAEIWPRYSDLVDRRGLQRKTAGGLCSGQGRAGRALERDRA